MMENLDCSETINVAYITDLDYIMPTCVSILSLISNMNSEETVKLFVICYGVDEIQKEKILYLSEERVDIEFVDVSKTEYLQLAKTCRYFGSTHVTATALFKFSLPNILSTLDKVLYLDGDTIIQKSLSTLYQYELSDNYVAAVSDMLGNQTNGLALSKQIDLEGQDYFNSGVMLLNLKKMRLDNIVEKLLDYRENGINYFMDQDALNAVLGVKRVKLPYIYNFLSTSVNVYDVSELSEKFFLGKMKTIEECIKEAVILHLTDTNKPWKYNMPWFSSIFFRYYNKSPYSTQEIYLKSPIRVLLNELQKVKRSYESKISRLTVTSQGKGYIVPYESIKKGCRLILYGAGKVGKSYYQQLIATQYCNIVLWVDRQGAEASIGVADVSQIGQTDYDCLLIAVKNREVALEIEHFLIKNFKNVEGRIVRVTDDK